ncbi:MAG: hypothetical protein ACE5FD_17220, partial [Anaerolineae bacterium]
AQSNPIQCRIFHFNVNNIPIYNGDQSVKHLIEAIGPPHTEVGLILANGRFYTANPEASAKIRGLWHLIVHNRRVVSQFTRQRQEDLQFSKNGLKPGNS